MFLHQFYTPGLAIYTYFIGDSTTKRAVVIDPTRNIEPIIKFAHENGFHITDIAETHVHADFASGSKELKQALNGKAIIHCSAMGGKKWLPQYTDRPIRNGDEIHLGSVRLRALHTPGHTPEHIVWLCYDDQDPSKDAPSLLAFTGDLLFVGGVGRPDLLGKVEEERLVRQLHHSLFEVLGQLPDFLEIYPGHGAGSLCGKSLSDKPTSTLGYERRFNSGFAELPIDEWIANLQKETPGAPMNFKRLKKVNVEGLEQVSEKSAFIIDLRHPEVFAQQHIKGAINIPFGSSFCNWVSSVLDENLPIALIGENQNQIDEAIKALRLIGFDQIVLPIEKDHDSLPLTTVSELSNKEGAYVLDVRTPGEWHAGHIPGAHHIELTNLVNNIDRIPKDRSIYVTCGSGYRASVAASLLKKHGYEDVSNVQGGMVAWRRANLPVETTKIMDEWTL